MELINQPFNGQLGDRLIALLDSQNFQKLTVFVAFARNSGVLRIKDALQRFRGKGGAVHVHVGVDLGGTSYEALTALLLHSDSLAVVHSEGGPTFHSKIYHLVGATGTVLVVGSNNLTGGGLWTNFESAWLVALDRNDPVHQPSIDEIDAYAGNLHSLGTSYMPLLNQSAIDALLQNGYVSKEVWDHIRRRKAAVSRRLGNRLFGNATPATLPKLNAATTPATQPAPASVPAALSQPAPPPSSSDDGEPVIWFETREMTGGSRNILDLSMKSLVSRGDPTGTPFDLGDARFMRGAVQFFGVNPADTSQTKDIILNFEGVDYVGNTILYPEGNKANGTWRLQIKGADATGRKITEAFREKDGGAYLVQKLVAFTKIELNYYAMSVFPTSDLPQFEDASLILAHNGRAKSARRLGIL